VDQCRTAKTTVTPFLLDLDETLVFTRADGGVVRVTLRRTWAEVTARDYGRYGYCGLEDGISAYAFGCELDVNGEAVALRREAGSPGSFSEPWTGHGVWIWLDAVQDIFREHGGFLGEKDWRMGLVCQPLRRARFAIQDATLGICPEPVGPWCGLPEGGLRIEQCYNGEDCWMGPYRGDRAHCGLDINMPVGARLTAPIAFDDQFLFHTVEAGFGNNRWRGIRRWPDGSEWQLQAHHLVDLLVPDRTPLARGAAYATTAGTAYGAHPHTHFLFRIIEQGGEYLLDPWLLFREMQT